MVRRARPVLEPAHRHVCKTMSGHLDHASADTGTAAPTRLSLLLNKSLLLTRVMGYNLALLSTYDGWQKVTARTRSLSPRLS